METITMHKYTVEDGEYFKITDELGNVSYVHLTEGNYIVTIQKVEAVTKEEYTAATGIEVIEIPEPAQKEKE